jgi:uncharacterized protein (DUF2141 family)
MRFTSLIGSMVALASVAGAAQAAEIKITIAGAGTTGAIYGRIFPDASSFDKRENSVAAFVVPPRGGSAAIALSSLPPGKYAIAVFQDVNGNQKLDTNLLGIPTEPYGFSNDAAGTMGPPGFSQAAVDLGGSDLAVVIHLR